MFASVLGALSHRPSLCSGMLCTELHCPDDCLVIAGQYCGYGFAHLLHYFSLSPSCRSAQNRTSNNGRTLNGDVCLPRPRKLKTL